VATVYSNSVVIIPNVLLVVCLLTGWCDRRPREQKLSDAMASLLGPASVEKKRGERERERREAEK
jgi:hypothetical protein